MFKSLSVVAGALSLLSVASGASLSKRADGDTFNLYAYGEGIGGLSICQLDGLPYVVDFDRLNDSSVSPEVVTFTVSGTTWLASTSNTSDLVFGVPGPNANSTNIEFMDGNNSTNSSAPDNYVWSGFRFYGHVAVLVDITGTYLTLFDLLPTSTDGLWNLMWNGTASDAGIIVALKDTPPSNSS